jgi:4-hydroxymandelate oxidase
MIGRPVLWGLAAGGEQGVTDILEMFRREISLAMVLAGCAKCGSITRDHVTRA